MTETDKRERISEAFVSMIGEKPLDAIRVKDIAARAGVSKATFYRLFRDKYDVMNWVFFGPTDAAVAEHPDLANWKAWSYASCELIRQKKAFFKKALSYSGQNSFLDFMAQYFRRNILRSVCRRDGVDSPPEDVRFVIEAFGALNAFAVANWIRGDCAMPLETLIDYVDKCIPEYIRRYFE